MGCGASNAAAVSKKPITKRALDKLSEKASPQLNEEGDVVNVVPNGNISIKVEDSDNRIRKLSLINEVPDIAEIAHSSKAAPSKGVQTEVDTICSLVSRAIQTDMSPFPEDELELLIEGNGAYFQTFTAVDADKGTSLVDRISADVSTPSEESSSVSSEQMPSGIHFSVGIQVKLRKISSSTQTRLAVLPPKSEKDRDSGTKKSHLWFDENEQRTWNEQSGELRRQSITKLHDFESQTDPISEILAANGAAGDVNVLHSYDVSSPFSHVGKELSGKNNNKKHFDIKLQECLNKLLDDIEESVLAPPRQG